MTRAPGIDRPDQPRQPWQVSSVAETGSTNDDLLRAAERGDLTDRTVLRADHQTTGRGRLDRRWDAPPGSNLLASVYVAEPGDRPTAMVQRFGVAIVEGVLGLIDMLADVQVDEEFEEGQNGRRRQPGGVPPIGVKWPNDVLLDGRKLAGVLAQRSTAVEGLVVGFGVNVGWAPPEAAKVSDIVACQPGQLLDAVLAAFDSLPVGDEPFSDLYRQHLLTLGQSVRIHLPGDTTFHGTAVDVDVDGRIIVRPDVGPARTFDVGDVVHLRPGDS